MTKPHTENIWYNKFSEVENIDEIVQNVPSSLDLIKNNGKCLFLVKSTNEESSFTMGARDCSEIKSAVICRKGQFDTVSTKQPPRFPCIAQNTTSGQTKLVKRDTQTGNMISNAGDE